MKIGNFYRSFWLAAITLTLALPGAAQVSTITLQDGIGVNGVAVAAITQGIPQLSTDQYTIDVPTGATSLRIELDLFGEKTGSGGSVTIGGVDFIVADGVVTVDATNAKWMAPPTGLSIATSLTINASSTPALTPGNYVIGVRNYETVNAPFVLTAYLTVVDVPTPTPVPTTTSTNTPIPTNTPAPSYTPTRIPTPAEVLGVRFPAAVKEGVPIDPVRSVQSYALGNINQMIPVAFAYTTPPPTWSQSLGVNVFAPGSDNYFYSLSWAVSDDVEGIAEGRIYGKPGVGIGGPRGGTMPSKSEIPDVTPGLYESQTWSYYPTYVGAATNPVDPITGVFGSLIYSPRYDNTGSAIADVVYRRLVPPGIELLPGLTGSTTDEGVLGTGAYHMSGVAAPIQVTDVLYAAEMDFVVDNVSPSMIDVFYDGTPVFGEDLADAPSDFFMVRQIPGQRPSVVVRWDGNPSRVMSFSSIDDIDIDRADTVNTSTIPSVLLPASYSSRNTSLNEEITITLNTPDIIASGRNPVELYPVDVAEAATINGIGGLTVDTLGNVGEVLEFDMDVDNIAPTIVVELFNETENDYERCIAGDGAGPSTNDQTLRVEAVIVEPELPNSIPGAGIDTTRITADLTQFGAGAAVAPDTITVITSNAYGNPSKVSCVWRVVAVDVDDDLNVTATVTAYDLIGNWDTGFDTIIGDNTNPVIENVVIVNISQERTDALRAGQTAQVIANVSDVLCGINVEVCSGKKLLWADLSEITGNPADTEVAPDTFNVTSTVAVWTVTCGNTTGQGEEIAGYVTPPVIINVTVTAKDCVSNTTVLPTADQGMSPLDNGAFPPATGIGIELDNQSPTVNDVIITHDDPPIDFIANGQTYTVTATITDRSLVDLDRLWIDVTDMNNPGVEPVRLVPTFIIQSATNPRPFEQITAVWTTEATRIINITRSDEVTMDIFVDVIPTDTLGNTPSVALGNMGVYEDLASIRLDNEAPTVTAALITDTADARTDCINNSKTCTVTADITDGPLGSGVTLDLITADLSELRLPEGDENWKAVPPDSFVGGVATWTFTFGSNQTIPTYANFDITLYDRVGNRRDVMDADPDGILVDNQGPTISNVGIYNLTLDTMNWVRMTQTAIIQADVTDGAGCGVLVGGITADLSQLTGNPADTAVAALTYVGGVASWSVTVGNTAVDPVNVNVTVTADDELGNTAIAAKSDPDGILLDNQPPVVLNALIKNITKDREDCATEGDILRISATINDGTGAGIDASGISADLTEVLYGPSPSKAGAETQFAPTSFMNGIAIWEVPVAATTSGTITVTITAIDRVTNENTGSDDITLDNDGPSITNVEIFNMDRGINTEIRRLEQARITATITDAISGVDSNTVMANLFGLSGLPGDAEVTFTTFDSGSGVATWMVTAFVATTGTFTANVDVWAKDEMGNLTRENNADPDGINYNNTKAGIADLNGDGKGDFADLLMMAVNWGKSTPAVEAMPGAASLEAGSVAADMNMDGVINESDLMIMLQDSK
jgi:hypothetical protein